MKSVFTFLQRYGIGVYSQGLCTYCMAEVIIMKINQSIGCEVSDCMFNCDGKNCTLDKIVVGNTCDCDAEKCTCCENYKSR